MGLRGVSYSVGRAANRNPSLLFGIKILFRIVSKGRFSQLNDEGTSVSARHPDLSGTKIASQNRSDHGGRKLARNSAGPKRGCLNVGA